MTLTGTLSETVTLTIRGKITFLVLAGHMSSQAGVATALAGLALGRRPDLPDLLCVALADLLFAPLLASSTSHIREDIIDRLQGGTADREIMLIVRRDHKVDGRTTNSRGCSKRKEKHSTLGTMLGGQTKIEVIPGQWRAP